MAGRIKEAWLVLVYGECSFERRFKGLEDELLQLIIQQSDSMEKLNAWAARMAKREKRAMSELSELMESPVVDRSPTIVQGTEARGPVTKYDRIRARRGDGGVPRGMGGPPPLPSVPPLGEVDQNGESRQEA